MLELILFINLAFSIAGFVFIARMWKEVKTRRDEYGENFLIPRGKEKKQEESSPTITADQMAAFMAMQNTAQIQEPEPEPEPTVSDGDLQRIVAAVMAAQKGA